jgi:predicted PurR-regulated permease PerM
VSVPTLVILLGAIGGLITNGFIGLFVGAVVLAVAHELGRTWLDEGKAKRLEPTSPTVDLGDSSPPASLAVEHPAHHH